MQTIISFFKRSKHFLFYQCHFHLRRTQSLQYWSFMLMKLTHTHTHTQAKSQFTHYDSPYTPSVENTSKLQTPAWLRPCSSTRFVGKAQIQNVFALQMACFPYLTTLLFARPKDEQRIKGISYESSHFSHRSSKKCLPLSPIFSI